jgi:hypothetical protein
VNYEGRKHETCAGTKANNQGWQTRKTARHAIPQEREQLGTNRENAKLKPELEGKPESSLGLRGADQKA